MGGKLRRFKFKKIKTWQLLLILVPLLFADATLLRIDHIKMTELRDAVLSADETGNEADISARLEELKSFTFSHIVINIVDDNGNQKITFGTGTFYLEHQYIRTATKALEEAERNLGGDTNPNGNVYQAASRVCQPLAIKNGWAWNNPNYINCMLTEINKYPASSTIEDQVLAKIPSTELYRKNYASPLWTFSPSGLALLLTALIIVVIFIRGLIWIILRIALLFL